MMEAGLYTGPTNYLTLSTALTEKDYEVFLSSLEAYLKEMKEPLAALAAASDQTVAAKL